MRKILYSCPGRNVRSIIVNKFAFGGAESQKNCQKSNIILIAFFFYCQIKPKIIAVLRSGHRPRKAVRVLLNHRNAKSFETLLADLTHLVKLDSGAVRRVFTLGGKAVLCLGDFVDSEVFVAYGACDKTDREEDFELDQAEFRCGKGRNGGGGGSYRGLPRKKQGVPHQVLLLQ